MRTIVSVAVLAALITVVTAQAHSGARWTLPRAEYELRVAGLPLLVGDPPRMIPDPPLPDYPSGIYGDFIVRADCTGVGKAARRSGVRRWLHFRCRVVIGPGDRTEYLVTLHPRSNAPRWRYVLTECRSLDEPTPSCPS